MKHIMLILLSLFMLVGDIDEPQIVYVGYELSYNSLEFNTVNYYIDIDGASYNQTVILNITLQDGTFDRTFREIVEVLPDTINRFFGSKMIDKDFEVTNIRVVLYPYRSKKK